MNNDTVRNLQKALELFEGGAKWLNTANVGGHTYCALEAVAAARGANLSMIGDYLDTVYELTPEVKALYATLPAEHQHCDYVDSVFEYNDYDATWPDIEAWFNRAIQIAGSS